MFTPQRKAWPAVSLTPRAESQRSGCGLGGSNPRSSSWKGKAVAFPEEPQLPPPPLASLNEDEENIDGFGTNNEDWKRFKEAGFLDTAVLEKKDMQALADRVSKLQKELFDYQHNMGLLLMEKKEWTSEYLGLKQEVDEIKEILKREQSAHLIALAEAEKREDNLRKALTMEKQCVLDIELSPEMQLEKALRETHEEQAQIQSVSQTKMAEADALVFGIDGKSSAVEMKLQAAEAKLAEVNRKSAETEMKLQQLESRENLLQKERLSFITDREAYEATFYKRREDLKDWEGTLQTREEALSDGRRILKQREERVNENENNLKKKERELEVTEESIVSASATLKEKEADVSRRLADISKEEERTLALRIQLENKEKELLALEEMLNAREKEGLQKLLDNQKGVHDSKLEQFEIELARKRESIDQELDSNRKALENREILLKHHEETVGKKENSLNMKAERVKEQSKQLEVTLKTIRDKENTLKAREKELETEKKELFASQESLQNLIAELEVIRKEISLKETQISEANEKLRITQEERSKHELLTVELKQVLEETRHQHGLVLKEAENLRQERERFEKEWEVLDEKKSEINKGQMRINEEKEMLNKLRTSEEDRLKIDRQTGQEHLKRELEKLELDKELFAENMRRDRQSLSEEAQNEYMKIYQDVELQRTTLQEEMHKRMEEMERDFKQQQEAFHVERDREQASISRLKDAAVKELEEVQSESRRLKRETEEVELSKQQLKIDQLEVQRDINTLEELTHKINVQRNAFLKERKAFIAIVDKLRGCDGCCEIIRDVDLLLPKRDESEPAPASGADDKFLKNSEGNLADSCLDRSGSGGMSWLRKCTTKVFSLSPNTKVDAVVAPIKVCSSQSAANHGTRRIEHKEMHEEATKIVVNEPQAYKNAYNIESSSIIREIGDAVAESVDNQSYAGSMAGVVQEDSQQSVPKGRSRKPIGRRKYGRNKTTSVNSGGQNKKVSVEGSLSELKDAHAQSSVMNNKEESRGDNTPSQKARSHNRRKRERGKNSKVTESETAAGDSDDCSDSVKTGGHRKRRQTDVSSVQNLRNSHYDLRPRRMQWNVRKTQADASKLGEQEAAAGREVGQNPLPIRAAPSPVKAAGENYEVECDSKVSGTRSFCVLDDKVITLNTPRDMVDANVGGRTSLDNVELIEEVSGTPEYSEDENGSTIYEVEDEYEEDDGVHPGQASFGKKIWKFFTS